MHSGPLGCLTKLGAKRAELEQKFVPRSRDGIFRNEHTRCIPLDPKLTFWCVSYYLGAIGTIWLPYETRCKTGQSSAKVRATKSHLNFSPRTHPIHPIGPKTEVSVRFILFGCNWDRFVALRNSVQNGRTSPKVRATKSRRTFRNERTRSTPLDPIMMFRCVHTIWVHSRLFGCLTKLGAKRAELVQKFVPRTCVEIFRNEHTRSTPLDPKLMFWCVRTIWVHSGLFGCLTKHGAKQAELV